MSIFRTAFRSTSLAVLVAGALLVGGCDATPDYLERWANTPGSEEKFVGYLKDPATSPEVKAKAVELLVKQWQYSQAYIRNGATLKDLPAPQRDAAIVDALKSLRPWYDADEKGQSRVIVRDAAFGMRQSGATGEALNAVDAILKDWLTNHWQRCIDKQGALPPRNLLDALGREFGEPLLVGIIENGSFEDLQCQNEEARKVAWWPRAEKVPEALIARWEAGKVPKEAGVQFKYLEEFLPFAGNPKVKAFLFKLLVSPDLDTNVVNLVADLLKQSPSADDYVAYKALLAQNSLFRWTGVQKMIELKGAEGLDDALASLPAEGDYSIWDTGAVPDALKRASGTICSLSRLKDLGPAGRQVFEKHLESTNVVAQALAVECLKTHGTAESLPALELLNKNLGKTPRVVPSWKEMPLQTLVGETITKLKG